MGFYATFPKLRYNVILSFDCFKHPSHKKLNYVIIVFHRAYLGVAEEKVVKTRNEVVSDLGSNHYSYLDGTDNRSSLKCVTRDEKK